MDTPSKGGRGTYYNEFDPYAADWIRNLGAAGVIANGEVDGRSIKEVTPDQLSGFDRAHFFAGIGGWEYALRLAGWPDDVTTWTGSCPCQPFSVAGKKQGKQDDRHLWPDFARLIDVRRPAIVFGEQVASKDGRLWLSGVRHDLEGMGYSVGAADLCAPGVGAPHIRQRLFWMAYAHGRECGRITNGEGRESNGTASGWIESDGQPEPGRATGGMADAQDTDGRRGKRGAETGIRQETCGGGRLGIGSPYGPDALGVAQGAGLAIGISQSGNDGKEFPSAGGTSHVIRPNSWSRFDVVQCTDGKARRFEPGTFPLVNGIPRGMGQGKPGFSRLVRSASGNRRKRLRGYGNAIVPELAAEFVMAAMDVIGIERKSI